MDSKRSPLVETPIPLSALQHYQYCPRQCALIHLEGAWEENLHTARGQLLHQRVDQPGTAWEHGVRVEFGVLLQNEALGLVERADRVEFRPEPFVVETKKGRPKHRDWDRVQLCAQALCLEEMLDCSIPEGALFYDGPKRREAVAFDEALRRTTEETIRAVRRLLDSGRTPPAPPEANCRACSLKDLCLPELFDLPDAKEYLLDESQR